MIKEPQTFEDAENASFNSQKDKTTFREIVLNHLRRISVFQSVEFHGGYWDEKQIATSAGFITQKTYIPDTREIFSNSVECLSDMLYPYFDKEMTKHETEIKTENDQNLNLFTWTESLDNSHFKGDFKSIEHRMKYRNIKRELSRTLFRHLCSFLYRHKYLDLGILED